MKLTAMTYNILSGRNLARDLNLEYSATVIREVQPDFVNLNEVRNHTQDIGPINQAYELGRITGYYPIFSRAIDYGGGEYGNAFLSRLPMLSSEIIHIPDPEIRISGHNYEHRCIQRIVLLAGEQPITIFGTHFGLAPNEQENAVQLLLDLIAKETNPVLVMGDLNAEPDTPVVKPLFDALTDTCAGSGILTFPSDKPEIKIDHILLKGNWQLLSIRCLDTQNSDHRPLIAELELN